MKIENDRKDEAQYKGRLETRCCGGLKTTSRIDSGSYQEVAIGDSTSQVRVGFCAVVHNTVPSLPCRLTEERKERSIESPVTDIFVHEFARILIQVDVVEKPHTKNRKYGKNQQSKR